MENELFIRRMRLKDSALIFYSALVLPEFRTISRLRQFLQRLQLLCQRQVWLAVLHDGQQEEVQSLFGLQQLDLAKRRCRLYLLCPPGQPEPALLERISSFCLAEESIFRLETELDPKRQDSIASFAAAGWQEESRLRAVYYNEDSALYEDRLLFCLLRPELKDTSVAFYVFRKAVLALVAGREGLKYTRFLRFGRQTGDNLLQGYAQVLGILNGQGRLLVRTELQKKLAAGQSALFSDQPLQVLQEAVRQLDAYFSGSDAPFDLPLDLAQGSPFQQRIWQALAGIPYGQTVTYEEIALAAGAADEEAARHLARAAGSACSANPFPLILPCHRVVGKNGSLTGFRGGLDIKEYLLGHEIMGLK